MPIIISGDGYMPTDDKGHVKIEARGIDHMAAALAVKVGGGSFTADGATTMNALIKEIGREHV